MIISKIFNALVFFILLEIQFLYFSDDYSWMIGLGIVLLILHNMYLDYGLCSKLKPEQRSEPIKLSKTSYSILLVFLILMIAGFFIFSNFSIWLVSTLLFLVIALGVLIFIEKFNQNKKDDLASEYQVNVMRRYTIPLMFLYLINFLLVVQINGNIASQFILILSVMVVAQMLLSYRNFLVCVEQGTCDYEELKHQLFHRWSKYLNYFLALWYFVSLQINGIVNEQQKILLIFLFSVIYITYTMKMIEHFKLNNFFSIVGFSFLIVLVPSVLDMYFSWNLPIYVQVLLAYIFYDMHDVYVHMMRFKETSFSFWEQKVIVYVLLTIFLSQLHHMEINPKMNLDYVFSSALHSQDAGQIMQPKIDVSDDYNATKVRDK
jgi:hypothetical protein